MRAVWYDRQGPAREVLQVGELPDPAPGSGELLIVPKASAVNPSDCNGRSGKFGRAMLHPRVVPHNDGAGIVVGTGEGVDRSWIDRRVWFHNAQRGRAFGAAADLIALDARLVRPLPDGDEFRAGACLGIPAMTAWLCVFKDGPVEGQTVLVTGGAGAVGHYAVQLAKWGKARVITTVSSPEKAEHARAAGADLVVDYRHENVAARVKAFAGDSGVHRVVEVDFGANLPVTMEVLAPNGVVSMYSSVAVPNPVVPALGLMFKGATVHFTLLGGSPLALRQRAQAGIGDWLATGKPIHRIAAAFPLAEAWKAHEAVEAGTKLGVVVVEN